MDEAESYVGVQEVDGSNRGPEINMFLASVGLPPGTPYCAAFVSFILDSNPKIIFPPIRSGLATNFITAQSMRASEVMLGMVRPRAGDIVIFRRGNGIYGHTGFVKSWDKVCGVTIEANTSPGPGGSQRDGDGVWERDRCITPGDYFRIVSFTPYRLK